MLWEALSTARDLDRLHEIASVLIRAGFGDLLQRLGMSGILERAGKILHWKEAEEMARQSAPARVRQALEELGPTFIKLGQIVGTRVDLFPPEWVAELEKLQDEVPAVPFEEIRAQLEEDLGCPPEEIFLDLNPQPLAAASIAQVYRARLMDGTEVVLKVRRPGIDRIIDADMRLLRRVAELIESEAQDLQRYRPQELIRQFTLSLRRELNLAMEAHNTERIRRAFADQDAIVIPHIHEEWSSERLNVQEYIHGIPGRDLAAVEVAGLDRRLLAKRGANAVLRMTLKDGFFHADPHTGNVFYLPENRIAFIDFGMVGRLSDERRNQVVTLLHGMVTRKPEEVVHVLLSWADSPDVNEANLLVEVDSFIDQYHGLELRNLKIGAMLTDLMALVREYDLAMPADLAMLMKVFISLEGVGRQLDPNFHLVDEGRPFLEEALMARTSPSAILKKSQNAVAGTLELLAGLPQDMQQLVRAARRGKLQVHVDVTRLKQVADQLDQAANRITVGIVTAAIIIGSSIVMTVSGGPTIMGLPLFGFLGFVGAAIGGVWLLFSIWRSARKD